MTVFTETEGMTDEEKELFLCDLRALCGEFFEADGNYALDITRSEKGFSVCIIFGAARVKKFKRVK